MSRCGRTPQRSATCSHCAKTACSSPGPLPATRPAARSAWGGCLEPVALATELDHLFQPQRLAGKRVLVTAGPTEEPIDPVRVLTNSSSGKMGYAVARAAQEGGANVTLG